jgi:SAM-dependent methyltransferase
MNVPLAKFAGEYAGHRAAEGRALRGDALRSLPYLRSGPLSAQWSVRARSFDGLIRHVIRCQAVSLDVLDLGAGNGWLCYRLAGLGHAAVAYDIRGDEVDGLGAAADLLCEAPFLFQRVLGSFEDLPFATRIFDLAVFNASLHYARDLGKVLHEAMRVTRSGGLIVILDSPFYRCERDGEAMVQEKQNLGQMRFGARAGVLLGQNFIEYLTQERLAAAQPELMWLRRRIHYPLWYEMRPLRAFLRGRRAPSRFDLWMARVP